MIECSSFSKCLKSRQNPVQISDTYGAWNPNYFDLISDIHLIVWNLNFFVWMSEIIICLDFRHITCLKSELFSSDFTHSPSSLKSELFCLVFSQFMKTKQCLGVWNRNLFGVQTLMSISGCHLLEIFLMSYPGMFASSFWHV